MENHLFIGLGGFGGQTIREIRKCEFLNKEFVDKKKSEGARFNVDYLYCDSSMDIVSETSAWKVLGEDVSLEPRDLVDLREDCISFDRVDRFRNVSSWLGNQESIDKYLKGLGTGHGANQRRRFGRFLFANNADTFLSKIQNKVSRLGMRKCTFHIFATFGGGTGSGSLIDAITIIRNEYHDDKDFPIFVHGYTTARSQDSDADVGFFFPNQYAVIRDLNALMVGKYQPQILTEQRESKAKTNLKYIDAVYLITPENKNKINFEAEEQIKLVGHWAYQRVMSEVFGYIGEKVKKAFTGEDAIGPYQGEPGINGDAERAVRFGSIGLIRWGIPEEETKEALMCDYLIQAYAQMSYNKWDAESGYISTGESAPSKDANILKAFGLNNINEWNLSQTSSHKPYEVEWEGVSDDFDYEGKDLKSNIKALIREFDDYSSQKFRGTGVSSYFQARSNGGIQQHVEQFESFLRDWVDQQWLRGDAGIKGILAQLDILVDELDGQLGVFQREADTKLSSVASIEKRWKSHADKPGWLAKQAGIEKKMFSRFSTQIVEAYVQDSRNKGFSYAIKVCDSMKQSVVSVIGALTKTEEVLTNLLTHFTKERQPLLNYGQTQSRHNDLGRDQIEFDRETYSNIWNVMRKNRGQVDSMISECRASLLEGQRSLITLYATRFDDLIEGTEKIAESKVKHGHDKACERDPNLVGKQILGKNIWDVFENSSSQDLNGRISGFLASGVTLAKRSTDRFQHDTLSLPLERKVLLNPEYNGSRISELKQMFKNKNKDKDEDKSFKFVTHDNPSEILCLSVDAAAPARLFDVVHKLEEHYQRKIEKEEGKYFIHLDFESEDQDAIPSVLDKD